MAKFTAIIEETPDGNWTASTLSPTVAPGTGTTRDAALADLQSGVQIWLEYMKETGQTVPFAATEVVTFEIAA